MVNNYNSTLQSNNTDLQAILNTINELPEASTGTESPTMISVTLSGPGTMYYWDADGNLQSGQNITVSALDGLIFAVNSLLELLGSGGDYVLSGNSAASIQSLKFNSDGGTATLIPGGQ